MPTNLLTMDMDQVHILDTGMIHINFIILKIFLTFKIFNDISII